MLDKIETIQKFSNKKSDALVNDENSAEEIEIDQPKLF